MEKNKEKAVLAICIPTFNRAKKLKIVIESLEKIIEKNNIIICISDNCSTDNTEDIVKELKNKFGNIQYSKNKKNEGFCYNFQNALNMPNAKYHWLFGDDDIFEPKTSINEILEFLEQNNYDLILSNNTQYEPKKVLFTDINEVTSKLGPNISWITSLILHENTVNNINLMQYNGTTFPHLISILNYFAQKNFNIYFYKDLICESLVMAKLDNVNDSNETGYLGKAFTTMVINFHNDLMLLDDKILIKSRKECIRSHNKRNYFGLVFLDAKKREKVKIQYLLNNIKSICFAFPLFWVILLLFNTLIPFDIFDIYRFLKKKRKNGNVK